MPLPLHLHTSNSLCAELAGGGTVPIGDEEELRLESSDERAVLRWYCDNPGKWGAGVRKDDIESLIAKLDESYSSQPRTDGQAKVGGGSYRLKRLQAHRFAGVHLYGSPDRSPEDFVFHFNKPITLFEGGNGSGKTSLVNTLSWCLTGELLRPQRPPESGATEFLCSVELPNESGNRVNRGLTIVTPLPSPENGVFGAGEQIKIDTWVEVTLVDDLGTEVRLRRTQQRNERGKIEEVLSPDFVALTIDPISSRIATIMPALLPFIRPGDKSEFGSAVAQLTGLAETVELSRHAARMLERLTSELHPAKQEELAALDLRIVDLASQLKAELQQFGWLSCQDLGWLDVPDRIRPADISELKSALSNQRDSTLQEAKRLLGNTFEIPDATRRKHFADDVNAATASLGQLSKLDAARRSKALQALSEQDLERAEVLIQQILEEAGVLAELVKKPKSARRQRLYAAVAAWVRQEGGGAVHSCPVCQSTLEGKTDPETGQLVVEHLRQQMQDGRDFVRDNLADWNARALGRLKAELPEALVSAVDLPPTPSGLVRILLLDEYFRQNSFPGKLAALRSLCTSLCDRHLSTLPPYAAPPRIVFPLAIQGNSGPLLTLLNRIAVSLAFARWRRGNEQPVRQAYSSIIGSPRNLECADSDLPTLHQALAVLHRVASESKPILDAMEKCGYLAGMIAEKSRKSQALKRYARLATALQPAVRLGTLVSSQIDSLRETLDERTKYWRRLVYNKSHTSSHELEAIDLNSAGVIDFKVGLGGAAASARHVSNTSALRANLVGFFLAFREKVLAERGGWQFLVLDDPQELLDDENRQRLAEGFHLMVEGSCQLVITSHDADFSRMVANGGHGKFNVDHRSVFPANINRPTLSTPIAVEGLEEKRRIFSRKENSDVDGPAQDYAAEFRIFLEARLAELFDEPAHSQVGQLPTLSDFLGKLRSKVNGGYEFFTSPTVGSFCGRPSLADGSQVLKLLNRAHHRDKHTIRFIEVDAIKDELKHLKSAVLDIHEEFRRWRRREESADRHKAPTGKLVSIQSFPTVKLPIYLDLAACTGNSSGGTQSLPDEIFDSNWFEDKSLFRVMSHNLGWAAPMGSIVVVESEASQEIEDRRLVIAFRGSDILARRLLRGKDRGRVALAAETTNPLKGPPTELISPSAIRMHKIVGVIFDSHGWRRSKEEAEPVESTGLLQKIQVAFQVKDTSALPLALPGQVLLGSDKLTPADFASAKGSLAALHLSDGRQIFKRLRDYLPGELSHIMVLESIGGEGDSVLAAAEEVTGKNSDFPVVEDARRILGVVYHQ